MANASPLKHRSWTYSLCCVRALQFALRGSRYLRGQTAWALSGAYSHFGCSIGYLPWVLSVTISIQGFCGVGRHLCCTSEKRSRFDDHSWTFWYNYDVARGLQKRRSSLGSGLRAGGGCDRTPFAAYLGRAVIGGIDAVSG